MSEKKSNKGKPASKGTRTAAKKNPAVNTAPAAAKTPAPAQAKAAKAAKAGSADKGASSSSALNILLWLVSIILIAGAVVGNWYYTQHVVIDESSFDRFIRVAVVIAVIAAGLGITLFTNKGRQLLNFGREAYIELRKVVWPTRQEAMQTTLIVFVAVCIVSLFLYLCDVVFLGLVRYITL